MGKNTVSAITRGTTPPIVLNVTNRTFDGCTVYVTIKETPSKNVLKDEELVEITKTGDDLIITPDGEGNCTLAIVLTQEETLKFHAGGKAEIQVRWIDSSGNAYASRIPSFGVDPILQEGVISYEE